MAVGVRSMMVSLAGVWRFVDNKIAGNGPDRDCWRSSDQREASTTTAIEDFDSVVVVGMSTAI